MRSIAIVTMRAGTVVGLVAGLVIGAGAGSAAADQAADLKAARAAVSRTLKDPSSARFEDVAARPGAVCGFVNAKNSMGGYAGRMLFVYVAADRAAYVLDPSSQAGPNWAAKAIAAYQGHCGG